MSPALSASPPGSASSHHQALTNSPHLVSPMGFNHQLNVSDTSPAGLGFHYQLPFTGTPLNSIGSLPGPGPGLGMVSGFPYPTMGQGQSPPLGAGGGGGGKASRPRMSRGPTARSVGKKQNTITPSSIGNSGNGNNGHGGGGEDDDSDFDDGDEGPSNGLGFSPTIQ